MTRRLVAATAALAMVVLAGCGETAEEPRPAGGADPGQQARAVLEKLDGEQVASRVAELRKLEFEGDGPEVRIVTPRQTVDYVRRQIERNYPADRIAADDAFLKLAGILPPDGGLRALLDRFAGGSILGFYDFERPETLQMITNPQLRKREQAESTLAHEYVHALQDQAFGIEQISEIEDFDRSSAASALLEGDARFVELAYQQAVLGGPPPMSPPPTGIPPAMLLYLAFPYEVGAQFVGELVKRGDGSFGEVDRAFSDLPESTEQIIHPEKYLADEQPREVTSNADQAVGDDWSSMGEGTFGELDALAVLSTKTIGTPVAVQAAEGWDGGTREVFERGEDRALAIITTWESEEEATEFAKAYEMSLGRDRGAKPAGEAFMLPEGQAADVVAAGRDVRIAVAPDPQLATKIAQEG